MSKIETFSITIRLRWGRDSAREIEVPIEYRKGSYSGRYELYVDNTHVGWVVKHQGLWHSYISAEQHGDYQRQCSFGDKTRSLAAEDVAYRLGEHARNNVLASRAEAAYAEK